MLYNIYKYLRQHDHYLYIICTECCTKTYKTFRVHGSQGNCRQFHSRNDPFASIAKHVKLSSLTTHHIKVICVIVCLWKLQGSAWFAWRRRHQENHALPWGYHSKHIIVLQPSWQTHHVGTGSERTHSSAGVRFWTLRLNAARPMFRDQQTYQNK